MESKCGKRSALMCLLAVLIIAGAAVCAAIQIQEGLIKFRSIDRFITVKGLAEREVLADIAVWPLQHTATGNDLAALQKEIDANTARIITFLKSFGIEDAEISKQPVQLNDLLAQAYRPDQIGDNRYILTAGLSVRTAKVDQIEKAVNDMSSLLAQGVPLANTQPPQYYFTKLNDIKPEMIADATKNAREAAQQFARDSGQKVGSIRTASQGLFQILPRDSSPYYAETAQKDKVVRIVTTVDFYLD